MVRKCSVGGCKTNYTSQLGDGPSVPTTIYGFPTSYDERVKWLSSLPNKIDPDRVIKNMGVCAKHFSDDVPMVRRGRYMVPNAAPSIFFNVPASCIPTPSCPPRSTTKSSSDSRAKTMDVDEMAQFMELDKLCDLKDFQTSFQSRYPQYGVVCYCEGNSFVLLSKDRMGPVHDSSVYCTAALDKETGRIITVTCEMYRKLQHVTHPAFPKGIIRCWSQMEEIVRFLNANGDTSQDSKCSFLLRQIQLQNTNRNSRVYNVNDLCLSLSWCTRSRSMYTELRNYIQLPSLSTLGRITRTTKNTSDESLYRCIFDKLDERSRGCIIIIDEIYVKASLSYRGGVLFGYAVDDPEKKATTLLCIMVKCMFGGPKFLAKLLPCAGLKADFQFNCVRELISTLEGCGAKVIAVINDNNRMNQSFFKLFKPQTPDTPWMVESASDTSRPMFLLYDPVHLLKNIRNNWLTEATKSIRFPTPLGNVLAKWSDLEELQKAESQMMVKLSKLTSTSVSPSNVEKQKVSLALNVFCDETICALKTYSNRTASWSHTALFIEAVVKLWKLLNCKSPLQEARHRDPDRIVLDRSERGERGLQTLTAWAAISDMMRPRESTRVQTLTKETAAALAWTCKCLKSLTEYLLSTNTSVKHSYVYLGFFQQDDLEKHFGYFRMSAGCNYYITVQEVMSTHTMDKARLMLKSMPDIDYISQSSHACNLCTKDLSDSDLLILDDMSESQGPLEVSTDEKQAIFYISGYIASKHLELAGTPSETPTNFQAFLAEMNRGGLTYPSEKLFALTLLAYTYFNRTSERFCRNRLTKIIHQFPAIFRLDLSIPMDALQRLSNILLKRFCLHKRQEDITSKQSRKYAKLSSKSS